MSVDAPDASDATTRACRSFVSTLPDRVAGRQTRSVDDASRGAAWGDPAIVLTCGVARAAGFNRFSSCQRTDGVDWFVPEDELGRKPVPVTMTTIDRTPRIRVRVPAAYWPPTAVMVDLADAVKAHTRRTGHCV